MICVRHFDVRPRLRGSDFATLGPVESLDSCYATGSNAGPGSSCFTLESPTQDVGHD